MHKAMIGSGLAVMLLVAALPTAAAESHWDPEAFSSESTLQLLTTGAEEGAHWSTVWLVVLDGEVYVRLGTRAAERFRSNVTTPYVKVRIAGKEFPSVRAEPVPGAEDRVAQAMADKYWSDILVRWMEHPLTLRLRPEPMKIESVASH